MPQKYIDMMSSMPNWIPFFGMMAGKSPLPTRLMEALILACAPIIAGYLWMIPKIETKLEALTTTQTIVMQNYSDNMRSLADVVKSNNMQLTAMQVDVGVLKSNMSIVSKAVDNIDDIANTKIRSTEGRLDSLEREIMRGKK